MSVYTSLREANIARQAEWDTGGNIDLSYAGNELAGEVSEAIAEAAMLLTNPSDPRRADLANELADVVICIDLIANRAGIGDQRLQLLEPVSLTSNHAQSWVNELGADLQGVCNTIKKLERERYGMAGSRSTLVYLEDGLRTLLFDTYAVACCFDIDLNHAVAEKFNATSHKVGLNTTLVA